MSRHAATVFTCEHGGNLVPLRYAGLFESAAARAALLDHRGCDAGALAVARELAARFVAPLHASTVTRLLVDLNRSPHNRALYSEFSGRLDQAARREVLAEHYYPYRSRISATLHRTIEEHGSVVHVAVHSFVPVFDGKVRRADVGLLYDPSRPDELALCRAWQKALEATAPTLGTRRNYPYLGKADGLTTWLRKSFDADRYAGVELELNQRLLASRTDCHRIARAVGESLVSALAGGDNHLPTHVRCPDRP